MISKATVKYIQSLQHKKFRDQFNCFIAEGPKVVPELLASGSFQCESIYATPGGAKQLFTGSTVGFDGKVEVIEEFELQKISALSTPNELVAVFKKRLMPAPTLNGNVSFVLDGIQDPGNLGTIIRIADWFNIKQVFCSMQTADMYNSKVVQSTMASLSRVNVYYEPLPELLRSSNIKKYAAVINGRDIAEIGKLKEGLIIIGNESKGVSGELIELADEFIRIPGDGLAESLNAAVACGIIAYKLTAG